MARLNKSLLLLILALAHGARAESWIDKFLGRDAHNKGTLRAEQGDRAQGPQELEGGNWIVEHLPVQEPGHAMAAHRVKASEGGQGVRRFLAGHMKGMDWMGQGKKAYQEEKALTTPTPTSTSTETTTIENRSLAAARYSPIPYDVPREIVTRIILRVAVSLPSLPSQPQRSQVAAVYHPPPQSVPQDVANRIIFKGLAQGAGAVAGSAQSSGAKADLMGGTLKVLMTKTQEIESGQHKDPTATSH